MMIAMEVEMMIVMVMGGKENGVTINMVAVMVKNAMVGIAIGMMNTEVEEVSMATIMAEEVEALIEKGNGLMKMKDNILPGICVLFVFCYGCTKSVILVE